MALAAQGFGQPRPPGRVDTSHFRRVLDRTQVVQLDSVNVLARAHYLPFYARLVPYSRDALDRWLWDSGEMFEYWGHEASLLPSAHRWLFTHRMEDPALWRRLRRFGLDQGDLVRRVLDEVAACGPISVSDIDGHAARGGWWGWSDAKRAREYLFLTGAIAVTDRRNFSRRYDLPERGDLEPVNVEGWREPAYVHRDAMLPRRIKARALLAPFDPVVWYRDSAERLFDFHYRIEIYTPATKRVFGCYVLPFLLDDRLVAGIDMKADRASSALLVRTAHLEAGADVARVASELTVELASMARWLELEAVKEEGRDRWGMRCGALSPASAR
ncbi:MAG: winged helix-turn-helix domain-containing protein [Dehalococcoidia bacterium]|nr:winged helix-turn-helix domain-containing protein [Dehalococcoidia bacterium]